jgi:putative DNA primase/helicase
LYPCQQTTDSNNIPTGSPGSSAGDSTSNVPQRVPIDVTHYDLPAVMVQAWNALIATNTTRPTLFRQGTHLVRLERSDDRTLVVHSVDAARLRGELARACWFHVSKRGQNHSTLPPMALVEDMLVNIDERLPSLTRIVRCPTFGPDGRLQDTPGYHVAGRIYFHPRSDVTVPEVPDQPAIDDVAKAKALILDELLVDFPFVSPADKANAVALLLLPYMRDLIPGPTPLHDIEAAVMGSGKGLLADVLLYSPTGAFPAPIAPANDDDEWRKRITSQLLTAPSILFIDNLNTTLDSGSFCAALTARTWDDRILGHSAIVHLPVRCIWVLAANNPILSTEVVRRSIRIRIDPQVERPWRRNLEDFKYPNLRQWVEDNTDRLIWACLVLIRYGLQHGKSSKTLGSFEEWSALMSRILNGVGISGFLDNLDTLYDAADTEATIWRHIVDVWFATHADNEVAAADIYNLIILENIDLPLVGKTDRALKTTFGMQLGKMRDRVIGCYRIEKAGKRQRAARWRLVKVEPPAPSSTAPLPTQSTSRSGSEPVNLSEPSGHSLRGRMTEEKNGEGEQKGSQGSQGSPGICRTASLALAGQIGMAVWHAHDGDFLIKILGVMGEQNGQIYLETDYGPGGVLATQVEFIEDKQQFP